MPVRNPASTLATMIVTMPMAARAKRAGRWH